MTRRVATPSQTVGPFFHDGLHRPGWSDLTAGGKAQGEAIRILGEVRDGDGAPVGDALLEIWQANAAGRYAHPEDRQEKPLDPAFRGFGRVFTDSEGRYAFTTVRPGPVPGSGNALQAPHINLSVFARGLLRRLATRIYFAGEALNEADPVLSRIEDPALRRTLLATPDGAASWRFDIVLQGEGETVFLAV